MPDIQATAKKIIANVERVIVGKRQQLILSLVSWFCEGHILLEDVPGVAKNRSRRDRRPSSDAGVRNGDVGADASFFCSN